MRYERQRLVYMFGHLVASHNPDDVHHADSGDLADEIMDEMGLGPEERNRIEVLAEHVADNYRYTGEEKRHG